ncbi:MAG: hypothetical protein ACREFO_15870 [Acetobacteraceae bacterium]
MSSQYPSTFCGCAACAPPYGRELARRAVLGGLILAGAALGTAPSTARAAGSSPYKAMLLSCVDPRTQAPVAAWMNDAVPQSHTISLTGLYSQFTIAGAAVGVVAPSFPAAWGATFWDNFGASIELHRIENLIVVDHSNCGALGIAYGRDILDDPKRELAQHVKDVTELKRELTLRHPNVRFQAWYVARDESGKFTVWKNLIAGQPIG